jgi:hypothetical protein
MLLHFSGPMLRLEDAAVYLDLEAALEASQLVSAEVQLRLEAASPPTGGPQFGIVRGTVCVDGCMQEVHTIGFGNAGGFRASGAHAQTMVAPAFGVEQAIISRAVEGHGGVGFHFTDGEVRPLNLPSVGVTTDGDVYTPSAFELGWGGALENVRGWPVSRMGILRPAGGGAYVRVTFGVARFTWGGLEGWGLYEHAVPLRP